MRIAHLSDLHVLDRRRDPGLGVRFVSLGRPIDAEDRRRKVLRAFERAKSVGANHFVVSGDLTETGTDGQYELFASILADARIDPHAITLVPGNHDRYARPDAWTAALEGPLRPWRAGAAETPGKIVDLGRVRIAPLDVTVYQNVTRSIGAVTVELAEALRRRFVDPGLAKAPLLAVQHHPPYAHPNPVHQWFDGLKDWARIFQLLFAHAHAFLMHGHLHRSGDRALRDARDVRIFGAPAIVDDQSGPRVRLYDVRGGVIEAAGFA
jgi:3',5'-cyclic AMP phosphodiesterase CpdA